MTPPSFNGLRGLLDDFFRGVLLSTDAGVKCKSLGTIIEAPTRGGAEGEGGASAVTPTL
jgi:hypothetical protein